ncbi:MAG: hypothetical protein LBB31_00790, partial [Prevotellaceae bacterium]|nr:hypothetical protein [Prevotellaceae bacterium]
ITGSEEPAAAGCYWFSECIYSTAKTYTVSMPDAGSLTVWAKGITVSGCVDSVSTTITVAQPPAITLTSGYDDQSVDADSPITPVTYTTANATGATAAGLPSGVSGTWTTGTYTLSGTPTTAGTYPYTVTTTNDNDCTDASASGTITVTQPCAIAIGASWSYCASVASDMDDYNNQTYSGFTEISSVSSENNTTMNWDTANDVCHKKGCGWRLPTKNELKCICDDKANLSYVGGYVVSYYFSSTLASDVRSYAVRFMTACSVMDIALTTTYNVK